MFYSVLELVLEGEVSEDREEADEKRDAMQVKATLKDEEQIDRDNVGCRLEHKDAEESRDACVFVSLESLVRHDDAETRDVECAKSQVADAESLCDELLHLRMGMHAKGCERDRRVV